MKHFSNHHAKTEAFFPRLQKNQSASLEFAIFYNSYIRRLFFIIFFSTDWKSPYPSALDFLEIKFEKSSSKNWIFNLQKINFKIDFCRLLSSWDKYQNRQSSKSIRVIKLSFCKNDSPMGDLNSCLFWYLSQLQIWCTTL